MFSDTFSTPTPPVAAAPTTPTPPAAAPTPVSAPTPPVGAVNVGNVAANLDPTAHARAAQQVVVNDAFDYETAFNLAFVGSGQGGARLASSFYDLGYRRVGLFNTAESDFQGLPDAIERHTLDLGGAAKTPLILQVACALLVVSPFIHTYIHTYIHTSARKSCD